MLNSTSVFILTAIFRNFINNLNCKYKMSKQVSKATQRIKLRQERISLVRAARRASSRAVRISTALQLPIQTVIGQAIVLQNADGTTVELKKVQQVKSQVPLSKGTKLCLTQKG